MDVVVCVKQVPGPDVLPAMDEQTGRLARPQPYALDEADSHGVELGLRLVEASGGGEVTLISMAPNNSADGLNGALAMGAAKSVVVSDERLVGSDALSTAKVLAAVIKRLDARLVIAGTESSDGYTGTMPVQCAELLSWPAITFANAIEWRDGEIAAQRQVEEGLEEVLCALPVLITLTAGAVQPRYPNLRGIMSARTKPVEFLQLADLNIDANSVGENGARQSVVHVARLEARPPGKVIPDEGRGHDAIIEQLREWRLL